MKSTGATAQSITVKPSLIELLYNAGTKIYGNVIARKRVGEKHKPSTTRRKNMTWNTPYIVEICVGLEVNAYFPADIEV
ncbi:MAG: pyrroloquinoline quinone precursor peptide PqqA [Pseudochelatococcus sp.]|jgi:coenzyme PQQ precursor peptide PqqA|uniref:pyrroloquinoline quinone precursor peptide PqqA n=1 Tax=Pseudochelatococcus sp. TaxID=2020869 RepID=UPI003D91FDD8